LYVHFLFVAIRSEARDEAHLIEIVTKAWEDYDSDTLERAWGHLHAVYRSIMLAGGHNNYPKPHDGVNKRQRAGEAACNAVVPMATFLHASEAYDELINPLVA
jgi:hypothetical protein